MNKRSLFIGRKIRAFINFNRKMAFRSHGTSNDDLINQLKLQDVLHNSRVEEAMKKVDRKNYCRSEPYRDSPSYIGYSVNISAPHMHCMALELLEDKLRPGNTALDVGAGSGYLTACMSLMIGPTGKTYGLEHIKELTAIATENITKDQPGLLESGQCILVTGDGRKGLQIGQPIKFDAIHVGAAAAELPQALIDQLKPGGRMVIPTGREGGTQVLEQIDKLEDGSINRQKITGVIYVPLTDAEYQYGKMKKN